MAEADFYLGEGDTAPAMRIPCRGRPSAADPDGAIVDLTGATLTFLLAQEDPADDDLPVTATAAAVAPATDGVAEVSWVDGYLPGRYVGRLKVTLISGEKLSFPADRHLTIVVTEDP